MTKQNKYSEIIKNISSLEELEVFIDELNKESYSKYPCISCNQGCFDCCTGSSFPVVYEKEWQRIRKYINKLPDEIRAKIIFNARESYSRSGKALISLSENEKNLKNSKNQSLINNSDSCPLLINGKCSVYSVRPVNCRIFGSFSSDYIRDSDNKTLTCKSDRNKINNFLQENNLKELDIPKWEDFSEKFIGIIYQPALNKKNNFSFIPLLLNKDIDDNKIIISKSSSSKNLLEYFVHFVKNS